MRCTLRLIAVALLFAALAWWIAAGARVGWWQTRVGIERTDDVTGLSVIEWQERFVPGVETPLVGLLVGAAGFAGSFLFQRKRSTTNQTTT
jgi:hypothetical protein